MSQNLQKPADPLLVRARSNEATGPHLSGAIPLLPSEGRSRIRPTITTGFLVHECSSNPPYTGNSPAQPQEAAIRLLESDPFRAADLYETVSLYRYPYSTAGEFNWQLAAHPYVALSMDREGQSRLREDNFPRHLEYLGNTKWDANRSRRFK